MVEAVVFDVGRVITQWDMRCLLRKLTDNQDDLDFLFNHVVTEEWHFQHDAGRDLDEMVAERKAEFPQWAHAVDAYATRFMETIPGPVPGTHQLVERLAERNVPLYAITNFAHSFWQEYRASEPLFDHFRDIVVSGTEKIAKPDHGIFHLAERRFGYAPQAMLFIDDNPANIAAAKACGWQTHHFADAGKLEADLSARGLLG